MTVRRAQRQSRGGGGQRGVALIVVLTTIAILASVGVDFSYSSRVSLKLAENLRDETSAYYMAKSGVNLARLLLHFQKQVDGMAGQLGNAFAALSGRTPAAAAPGLGAPAQGSLNIRLWELLPIDSNAFTGFLSGSVEGLGALTAPAEDDASKSEYTPPRRNEGGPATQHSFGEFPGSFSTKIVDENSRINVALLNGIRPGPLTALISLRALMNDPKYNFIFDEEDAQRDRVSRDDVILAMRDWVDFDETGAAIDPTNTTDPFVNGFSDENSAYDRYTPRYKAKNDKLDSVEELYMVRGVNDRFMAAFGDRLTVWPNINSLLNINTNDPQQMALNILIAAANPNNPVLRDPRLLQTIIQEIQLRKMFSFFGMSPQDFVSILKANGIQVRPEIDPALNGNANNFFSSTSDTFRVTATGRIGRIEKKVTAVVRYDDALGKLLYWKED